MAVEKTPEALSNRLLDLDRATEERNSSRFRELSDSKTYEFVESMNKSKHTNELRLEKILLWLERVWEKRKVEKHPHKRTGPLPSSILPACQEKD